MTRLGQRGPSECSGGPMSRAPICFPSPEEGLSLHLRLSERDPVACAGVCQAYLSSLLAWLEARFPDADPHQRQTAVHDAVLRYVMGPERYDPRRADLGCYLRMAARARLSNLRRQEGRHGRHRVAWLVVELGE